MIRTILFGCVFLGATTARVNAAATLADAAQNQDRALVRTLVQQKADVNAAQGDGMTALHWAATNDDVAMAQMLVDTHASVKTPTRLGSITPLFIAAKTGSARMIELLLKAGADANSADGTGATPLMIAAASGSADAVEMLLSRGADVNAKETSHGQTALMFAAAFNRAEAIRALRKHGADAEIASIVADAGCGSLFANSMCGGGRNKDGADSEAADESPAASGKEAAAAPRRRRGAAVIGGMTALLFAARDGRTDAAMALVETGADVNDPGAGEKMTPLVMAITNGHYELASYLLNHGANPNLANIEGLTALYATLDMQWAPYAYRPQPIAGRGETSYLDLMQALLDHGANPNTTLAQKVWFRSLPQDRTWVDQTGSTAFWRAAQATDVEAMRLLMKAGADPKLPSQEGVTPLMVAAGLGWAPNFSRNAPDAWLASVKYCLDLGLDVNAKSTKGYTALHGTAFIGNNELVRFLVDKGADVHAVSNDKNTVADMANGPIEHSVLHPDTVALLEELGSQNSNNCRSDTCVVAPKQQKQRDEKPKTPAAAK